MVRSPKAYGQGLAETFHLDQPPVYFAGSLKGCFIAATEIRCEMPCTGLSEQIPREPAYLMAVHVSDRLRHELWLDGQRAPTAALLAGTVSIYDLRLNPIFNNLSPFHALYFYLPQRLLDCVADEEGHERISEIRAEPGVGLDDPTIRDLAGTLLPSFYSPGDANLSFIDHVLTAIAAYIVQRFGKAASDNGERLTNAQLDRIEELLDGDPELKPTASRLAAEIGLPPAAFRRAFQCRKGVAPERWLLHRRIEKARDLLLRSDLPVPAIAAEAGFSDAKRFIRVFTATNGLTPVEWRNGFF